MRKFTSLALFVLALTMPSLVSAEEHEYRNGICIYEDCTSPYEAPQQDIDGFYMLRNAGNVEWLSRQVADGIGYLNAKLMNDIDFENIENLHSPIGPDNGHKYNATFDGQGFRIKNMVINRPNSERQGFFGALRGNPNAMGESTIIKNLIIDKSCSIIGGKRTGGICGSGQNNEREIYIMNCVNEASVSSPSNNVGGILGGSDSNHPKWQISNCINTGTITSTAGTPEAAGITSWCGDNAATTLVNCINIGEIVGMDASGRSIFRHSGSLSARNNIDLSFTEGATQGIIDELTIDDIASGKLCYTINGNQSEIFFYQTLGEDEYPVPFATSKQVYLQGELLCDGTPLEGGFYTNTLTEPVVPDHETDGESFYCLNCGKIDDKFVKPIDGIYHLTNVLEVQWFAAMVTEGHTTISAVLENDLDFTDVEFEGIGSRENGFKGFFDGQFHVVSNLEMITDRDWVGFFNFLNGGATIQNLELDETCFISGKGNIGLIGGSTTAGEIHLTNLGMKGDCSGSAGGVAGVLGCNTGSSAKVFMTNCYSTGFYSGAKECAAICAWLGSNGAVVKNCWSTAMVSGIQNEQKYLFRHDNATLTNCYGVYGEQCIHIEEEEAGTGSLCYKLNGDQSEIAWYQNIDEGDADDYPTFMPGHGVVYANAVKKCDGSFNPDEVVYSNADNSVVPPHHFVDGFCSSCGLEDDDYDFLRILPNADHDIATGYTNVDSGDGSGLAINNSVAEHWNQRYFTTTQGIKGLQKGVYKLRVQGLQRVRAWGDEAYADGVLSEEFAPLYHSSQYFAEVGGKKVANLFMDIAEGRMAERVNETENYNEVTDCWVPNSLAACRKYFAKGKYWNKPLYFYVEDESDSINIGVENRMYLYGNWTVWDTWRLEYVGDNAASYDLIRQQQLDNVQDFEQLIAQASLMEAYETAKEAIRGASSIEEILENANILSTNPLLIRESHLAYEQYHNAIQAIIAERENRDDLNGEATDLLDKYLEDYEETSDKLPHGTYLYIYEDRPLNVEELQAEIQFAQELLSSAIKNSISEGSDLTNLVYNPAFSEDGNFAGWTYEITRKGESGSNFSSNSGFTDIYPVAGTWHTAFDLWQDLEDGLPNGIYEIEAPAFYRPGGNGMGDLDGNDYIPASIYINDYYTPIANIYTIDLGTNAKGEPVYGQMPYEEAINGVNCRFDPNEEGTPHAGESTGSIDFDTGMGYVPEQRQAVSIAFGAGRYINHAYAIVTDGKLRLGIRNTGRPWYDSGMAMWGKFTLRYHGKSEEAIGKMVENFNKHVESLSYAQSMGEYLFSLSHIANIERGIAQIEAAGTIEAKMAAVKAVNDEFNTIHHSCDLYQELNNLMEYCNTQADANWEANPDLSAAFAAVVEEIMAHTYDGDLTDDEVEEYIDEILNRAELGGGYYVQGDLVDLEGNELSYGERNTVYPMTKQADGTYTATIKTQNRANLANANARAGVFISRLSEVYKCNSSTRRFVTPANGSFAIYKGSTNDFQMVGGEFEVTFDPKNNTIDFKALDYKWHDNVFVVGSILDQNGEEHRWKNDEVAPLAHQGNGVYEGEVTLFADPQENFYGDFTIMSCRSNLSDIKYSIATRSGWNEGRYGSEVNKTELEDGVMLTDLVRGADRKWMYTMPEGQTLQAVKITFDMNRNTIVVVKADGQNPDVNGDGQVDVADVVAVYNVMAEGSDSKAADVNGDGQVDVADVVAIYNTMAARMKMLMMLQEAEAE